MKLSAQTAYIAILLVVFTAAPMTAQRMSARDSTRAVLAAIQSLKTLEYRIRLLENEVGGSRFFGSLNASCEISVADYCYGPRNGGIVYGGLGASPSKPRYAMRRFHAVDQDRINLMINRYIDTVAHFLKKAPNDPWLSSEIVRLDLNRGNYLRAWTNVKRCAGAAWWCEALAAHIMNMATERLRSDSVWEVVLGKMPEYEKCAWLNPVWVSGDKAFNRHYRELSCAEQIRIAQRVWWMSDPLYSVPGNERRAEHLSRLTELVLDEGAIRRSNMTAAMILRSRSLPTDSSVLNALEGRLQLKYAPWKLAFSWGYTEVVMRAGPPHFAARAADGSVTTAVYPHPRVSFVPHARTFLNHLGATADSWSLHETHPFEFMNGWTAPLRELDFQIAWFRRGDSARVVAASDISADSVFDASRRLATMFLQRDYDQPATTTAGAGAGVLRFSVATPPDSTLASIEILSIPGSGRARFATGPPPMPDQRISISDVVLVQPDQGRVTALDEALQLAYGRTTFPHGSAVQLFWEVYGLTSGETADVELVVTRQRESLLGGLLRPLTSRSGVDSTSVSFAAIPATGLEVEPGSVTLSLASLSYGRHTLYLRVRVPGQEVVSSRREIEILRPVK